MKERLWKKYCKREIVIERLWKRTCWREIVKKRLWKKNCKECERDCEKKIKKEDFERRIVKERLWGILKDRLKVNEN